MNQNPEPVIQPGPLELVSIRGILTYVPKGAFPLTIGEAFLLDCRRRGWTMQDAAEHYRAAIGTVHLWSRSRGRVPTVTVGIVTSAEQCWLGRRRRRWTQYQLARAVGINHREVVAIEAGEGRRRYLDRVWRWFEANGWFL